jgi:hypothetical protein
VAGVVGAARGRKPGGTAGTRRSAVETAPGGVESSELGTSSSVAARGAVDPARRGVLMGGTTGASSVSKKIQIVSWMGRGGEGKNRLIKNHVSGDHEAISGEVEAAIAFMVVRIAEEDTRCGVRSKLVGCGGRHVRVTRAGKHTKMLIRWGRAEQSEVRAQHTNGLGREPVEQKRRSVKALDPIGDW